MPSLGGRRLNVLLRHFSSEPELRSEHDEEEEDHRTSSSATSTPSASLAPATLKSDDDPHPATVLDLEGAKFGAINALRSGNPVQDMMVAMVVPMAFKAIFDGASMLKPAMDSLMAMFSKPPEMTYLREIKVTSMQNNWGCNLGDRETRNTVLARAMTLYLASKDIPFKTADVNLVGMKENRNRWCDSDDDDNDNDDDDEKDSRSEAGQLKKNYRLSRQAPEEQWVQVEPGIMFMKKTEDGSEGEKESRVMKKTITMSIMGKTEAAVDGFIEKAYTWYLDELRSMQDHSRYMYELVAVTQKKSSDDDGGGGDDGAVRKYRRYKLSDEKTFESLFFPEKDNLLKLIKDFQDRSGKYAIPGYPHKLGLLCHGPPGTGKTSMIKAMAHHTKRNIVNVPLARIGTNSELMDVMFDNRYQVVGQEVPIKLRFKDVIFVMEDVDAISKIVHRRDGKDGDEKEKPKKKEEAKEKKEDSDSEEKKKGDEDKEKKSKDKDDKEEEKKEKKEEDKKEKKDADEKKDKKKKSDDDDDDEKPSKSAPSGVSDEPEANSAAGVLNLLFGPTTAKEGATTSSSGTSSGSDRLNLSGILNALDGVVDSPNRILIMTTNHPEKLDPALIRPGRIDKKFLLSYMCGEQAAKMVSHYFQTVLDEDHVGQIKVLVDGAGVRPSIDITPARLEQICAEHDTIDGLLLKLKELAGFDLSKRPKLFKTNSISVENVLNVELTRAQSEMVPSTKRW